VLPPSLHPGGEVYRWMGAGDPADLPYLPAALLGVWRELICLHKPRAAGVGAGHKAGVGPIGVAAALRHLPEESPRQVAIIREALRFIDADCAYETWRNVVWGLMSTRWNCAVDLAREWSMTGVASYDEAAFDSVVRSYIEERGITLGTVIHFAKQGGYHAIR